MGKDKGYIKLYRSITENHLWKERPFSKGQAWVDLILLANHQTVKKLKGDQIRTYEKGTVNLSVLMLSERWGWDRRKTKRFLMALESDGMLSLNSTTQGTTLTLINYGFYNDDSTTNSTSDGTTHGTTNAQRMVQATNKNDKELIKNDKKYINKFVKPSLEDIQEYISENTYEIDAQEFFDYYESNGWTVGRNKMKDWKATVRNWARRSKPKTERSVSDGTNNEQLNVFI